MNTTSARDPSEIPDLILEQYRLRELPVQDADRVQRLLSADARLRERLDALERSDDEIAREYPAAWLAQRIRARMPPAPSWNVPWRLPLALAGAAILVFLAIPRAWLPLVGDPVAPAATGDRDKGHVQPSLAVYRRTATSSETLADGSVARAGDLLRLGYAGAGRSYGIILSIDGRGVVTLHLPPSGDRAARLGLEPTLLDQAYELDDAPGWERFYFVTGDTPFPVAPIMDAARKASAGGARRAPALLPLSRDLSQSTFSIQKEVRP